MIVLQVKDLTKKFGGVTALDALSFEVRKGETLGLIGPNGSGKTTCFNVITGIFPATSGDVVFQGRSLHKKPVHEINLSGIARTFQNLKIFPRMTVWDNVLVARFAKSGNPRWKDALCFPSSLLDRKRSEDEVAQILDFVGLMKFSHLEAESLPYGHKRKLEIGRALATRPELLLLDEPAAGMNAQETESLLDLLEKLHDSGLTMVVIEHDMRLIMGISSRIIVLNYGQLLAEGSPEEIRNNPSVIEAYLGGETKYA